MRLPGFLGLLGSFALAVDLGSLEPGKLADLIVLDKNPLEDIRNTEAIRMVMKNGRLYQGDDLQEIWPRRRSLPAFWWVTEAPDGRANGGRVRRGQLPAPRIPGASSSTRWGTVT